MVWGPNFHQSKAGPTIAAGLAAPAEDVGHQIIAAHEVAVAVLREKTSAKVGMSLEIQNLVPSPGSEDSFDELERRRENLYIEALQGDDFIGVQSYAIQTISETGIIPAPEDPSNTQMGWRYQPDAIGRAVRWVSKRSDGVPIVVTESGIATADDAERIAFTRGALQSVYDAIDDGISVRGYCHWSALDKYEWGHWGPTFGLVAVDKATFARHPKPSLEWLGQVARSGGNLDEA